VCCERGSRIRRTENDDVLGQHGDRSRDGSQRNARRTSATENMRQEHDAQSNCSQISVATYARLAYVQNVGYLLNTNTTRRDTCHWLEMGAKQPKLCQMYYLIYQILAFYKQILLCLTNRLRGDAICDCSIANFRCCFRPMYTYTSQVHCDFLVNAFIRIYFMGCPKGSLLSRDKCPDSSCL